jgi:hypothetical protein
MLGAPEDRQFRANNEAWQYCATDMTGMDADHFKVIWFTDGQVTGVSTYRSRVLGTCESNFRSINWEERPDATVEVRYR